MPANGTTVTLNGSPLNMVAEVSIKPQEATIRKVNRGFIVVIGCQSFIFEKEKDMFTALQEYWKNPAAAQKKYVDAK